MSEIQHQPREPHHLVGEMKTAGPGGQNGSALVSVRKNCEISVKEKRQTDAQKEQHLGRLCTRSRDREGRQEKTRREGNMPRLCRNGKINTFREELTYTEV